MTHTQHRPWTTTLREHQRLRQQISKLKTFLSFGAESEDDVEWAMELVRRLADLGDSLGSHFDHEEHSSLFRTVPFEVPRFAHRIDAFRSEHRAMMRDLGAIQTRLADSPSRRLSSIAQDASAFLGRVERHEEGENEILQEVYQVDVAAAD
ncbi:MAG: hemerythrin domain-containing protein [Deltaproteobacteria bacterium]|nr:hemerythrin domain-containing protein [Deltaproteobacteria bacterium]